MEKYIRDNKSGIDKWSNEYPIGNGHLGAMVSGFVPAEIMTLNEDTLWYGPHREREREYSRQYVDEVRKLLAEGKVKEADKLCFMGLTSVPKYYGAYQPLGELWVYFNHGEDDRNYIRYLDLENGIATTEYDIDGLHIKRECFVSYPDDVLVFRITADKPKLDVHFHLQRRPCDEGTVALENDILCLGGQCGVDGVHFECMLDSYTDGNKIRIGDFIGVDNATEVVIYISAMSEFKNKDFHNLVLEKVKKAKAKGYKKIYEDHIKDFSGLYNRSAFDFGTNGEEDLRPTYDRIQAVKDGKHDNGLFELMFNMGKYIMISSSRPGSQAMNLQGIWNKDFAPPWDCNYTININLEMNYWIAESCNLSECHIPLFDLIERMVPNGEKTAKKIYGCNGFVAHHCTDIWGDTAIEGISFPSSIWPMGGAWLTLHMWEHYKYTLNKEFLEMRAFPVMRKCVKFFSEYMVKDENGFYITGPSVSPENVFLLEDGTRGRECMGPEMDLQIVRAIFTATLSAYEILGIEDDEYACYKEFEKNIRPIRINKFGGIMEWDKDYDEAEPGHRHISQLFALYPDNQISKEKTPKLADACLNTLDRRLSHINKDTYMGLFGWSTAWVAACFARLGHGDRAYECLNSFIYDSLSDSFLNDRPEFQIDGNMGVAAAIKELFVQCSDSGIVLFSALPEKIKTGSFKGIKAYGGFEISAEWNYGKIIKTEIMSINGARCKIKAPGLIGVNSTFCENEGYIEFDTQKGEIYRLIYKE